MYRQSYDFLQLHRCAVCVVTMITTILVVSQPSDAAGPQSPLDHITTLQP